MSYDEWYQPGGLFGGNDAKGEEEFREAVDVRLEQLGLLEEAKRYNADIYALDEKIMELNGQLFGTKDDREAAKLRADVVRLVDNRRLLRADWKVKCSDAEAAWSAKQGEAMRKRMSDPAVMKKEKEIEKYLRAQNEQQRRRGPPDERVAKTKAATATGDERLWNLFAEKRGGPFKDAGPINYQVWALTLKDAKLFAKRGVFALTSTARGIRSITSAEGVELAPYLSKPKRR